MQISKRLFPIVLSILLLFGAARAQTTEFTYQGSLRDAASPANGSYDFEFRLFSTETGGAPIAVLQRLNVAVVNGIFTVKLDFGANFTGAGRWLELAVKNSASGGGFQPLSPRQAITSQPYNVRSLTAGTADTALLASNAQQLGGVGANQFVLTADSRLTDARNPLPGSPNYIQNSLTPQAASNFNVSGTGTANILNAAVQFNIGGSRVLSVAGTNNLFAGAGSGAANTTGGGNSFFGSTAGGSNTIGGGNSFFGNRAGTNNQNGSDNSFFGSVAGLSNTTGIGNSMFGVFAGLNNAAGSGNSFFGYFAGQDNTSGSGNSFFGNGAGLMNMTGANNTMIGAGADVGANNLTYATAIGADAVASQSNSIFLGRADGSDAVRIPGSTVIGGTLVVNTLGSAGSTTVCLNAANRFAPCSSSLRYKTDVRAFTGGLEIVRRLRPVSFKWIDGGASDVGFGAEDVANIEPLLTTRNDRGEIEGVKYPQISTVLVNAVNEQQTEIEQLKEQVRLQQRQLEEQSRQIEALKSLVCALAPAADCSKEPKPR